MRVIAMGSKHFRDWDAVRGELKHLTPGKEGDMVVVGHESGADAIVRGVCDQLGLYCVLDHEPMRALNLETGKVLIFHTDAKLATNSKSLYEQALALNIETTVVITGGKFK